MIKVKHFLDKVEPDDGQRLWVEPFGLVKELREWCNVDHVLPHVGRAGWIRTIDSRLMRPVR